MALNFSGMMKGFGAGLSSAGALMAEQAKLDWQAEQARLAAERQERLARLQIQATREENKLSREQNAAQFGVTSQLQRDQLQQNAAQFGVTSQLQRDQFEQSTANSNASLGLQQQQLELQRAQANRPSAQREAFTLQEEQKQAMLEKARKAGVPEDVLTYFEYTGKFPDTEKPSSDMVDQVFSAALTEYEDLDRKQKKQYPTAMSYALSQVSELKRQTAASSPYGQTQQKEPQRQDPLSQLDRQTSLLAQAMRDNRVATVQEMQKRLMVTNPDNAQAIFLNAAKAAGVKNLDQFILKQETKQEPQRSFDYLYQNMGD